jgi:hypothetical protein
MKKTLVLLPLVAALTACGTFSSKDQFEKRADEQRERQEKIVERSLDKAPKWMTDLPKSPNAVYAAGTAVSSDFSMADDKAKLIALGKICMAAGGEVDKQSKVYIMDTQTGSTESSEMAIRGLCRKVDVTGAERVEIKRMNEGGRYRTYVLMALPTGDANQLRKDKLNEQLVKTAETRSREAFKELDNQSKQ